MKNLISSYRDLLVWQKSIQLAKAMYAFTKEFPDQERFGITQQMRRAAVSIPSNIAEGSRRGSRKDYRHHVLIAYGSGSELETQLEIIRDENYGDVKRLNNILFTLEETMRMLNRLQNSLK